jgi:hypothetical protein
MITPTLGPPGFGEDVIDVQFSRLAALGLAACGIGDRAVDAGVCHVRGV